MTFTEGEETESVCPKCGKHLIAEMGFQDCFSHTSGHYTIDVPTLSCECGYSEEIEPSEPDEPEMEE